MADALYQWGLDGASLHMGECSSLAEAVKAVEDEVCSNGSKYPNGWMYVVVSFNDGKDFDPLLLYDVDTCEWRGEE